MRAHRRQLLTASRMNAMLACPRRHYWRYEVGLRRAVSGMALRFGSAWHRAMEARWQGKDLEELIVAAFSEDSFDEITVATLTGLLAAYFETYRFDEVREIHPEVEFSVPIRHSRTFAAAGKIDGLAVLDDGRLALVEHKTTGSSIAPDSDYWLRLRADLQILQYVGAARALGWDISLVLYDVARKPAIKQRKEETPAEFGERLRTDALARPEFYFARREVPVLDQDLEEFEAMRVQVARMILDRRREQRTAASPERAWPRYVNGLVCPGCEFASFCLQNVVPDTKTPPAGYAVGRAHTELEQVA